MEKNVEVFLEKMAKDVMEDFTTNIEESFISEGIESPIEKLFYTGWKKQEVIGSDFIFTHYDIMPQCRVDHGKSFYLIDFAILPALPNKMHLQPIAVELDGHWHERTASQAGYDKKRDRCLTDKGWAVLHFTGREVAKKPEGVVNTVVALAQNCILQAMERESY